MTRPVFEIDALIQKELLGFIGALEDEFFPGSLHYPVLDLAELEFENLLQVILLQASEHHHLVYSIHELGREFPFCRLRRGTIDLLIYIVLEHSLPARRS